MTKSAAILAAVNSVLLLAVAFGAPLSENQLAAVGVALNALLVLIAAWRDPQVPFGRQ